jgi:hypothetical protein
MTYQLGVALNQDCTKNVWVNRPPSTCDKMNEIYCRILMYCMQTILELYYYYIKFSSVLWYEPLI